MAVAGTDGPPPGEVAPTRSENGSTRLISRNGFRLPTLAAQLGMLPMEPASLVME